MHRTGWYTPPILMAGSVIAIAGAVLVWWMVAHQDRTIRENFLNQARMVADAVDRDLLGTLSGTPADIGLESYTRIKHHLAGTQAIIKNCRFLYLMGRKENGDVFFFADSEPAGSADESPAGQIYDEISPLDVEVFKQKVSMTTGPDKDRWGTWISAMVPIVDPKTRHLAAVLGMDFDARDFRRILFTAGLRPFLFTLFTLILLVSGTVWIGRSVPNNRPRPFPMGQWGPVFAVMVTGLFLSLCFAWVVYEKEVRFRTHTFERLAMERTVSVANALHSLLDLELEALVRFYEASEVVTPREFQEYTDYLLKNPMIENLKWVLPVPALEKQAVVSRCRREGLPAFTIWVRDEAGNVVTAKDADVYFPVVRMAPLTGDERALGYDLGSEPLLRMAFEASLRTGMPTCSSPIHLGREKEGGRAFMVCRPVFHPDTKTRLMGFIVAFLGMEAIGGNADPEEMMILKLVPEEYEPDPETHESSLHRIVENASQFSLIRPFYIFDKVFYLSAHAGPDFGNLYPVRGALLTAFAGMAIAVLLAVIIGMTLHRRRQLESLVVERTARLNAAEQRMDMAIRGADLGTWDWDVATNEIIVNRLWAEKLGYDPHEVMPRIPKWEDAVYPEDLPAMKKAMDLYLEGHADFYETEHRLLHKSGAFIWVLVRGSAIETDHEGKALRICGTFLDITTRKQAEEEREKIQSRMLQAQKMEAIGRLAGGVAHDLNNLLSPIIGYGEMLANDPTMDDEKRTFIDAILSAGFKARDLVSQLLAFGRKQRLAFRSLNINHIIADFEKLLTRTIPENITIALSLSPEVGAVKADAGQMEQVIMNLAVNAAHAMPDGGTLTIKTAAVEMDEALAASSAGVKPGPYVMMQVKDTGCGMEEAVYEKIFEPFFSTKGDQGTGLGLATVLGIVKQHGGNIQVHSTKGKGTTFTVLLPASGEEHAEPAEDTYGDKDFSGSETILLVEDNASVRNLVQSILTRQGYRVLAAENGAKAMSIVKSHTEPVHLLLTDVMMPGMNGRELYLEVLKIQSKIKVLYMSGHTEDALTRKGVPASGGGYLQKPFTVQGMAAKVRHMLDDEPV